MKRKAFSPYMMALGLLEKMGVDFEAVYNGEKGIKREQLKILSALPLARGMTKTNVRQTIKRLSLSDNKKKVNFAANVKNTMVGTVSGAIVHTIDNYDTIADIEIRWLPSEAKEEDAFHALNYGKRMTLKEAKKRGLGVRYNCQCQFEVVKKTDEKKVDEFFKNHLEVKK
ncbi:TPA: hypothetical protein P0E12_004982 [Vibrio harveyi]|nr:hypothetical protein [Vibrio harveyi]